MRKKVSYNIDEIVNNLYTFGEEYETADGNNYIGLYHKYIFTDEIYTQPSWDKNTSVVLNKTEIQPEAVKEYKKLNPNIKTSYDSIIDIIPEKKNNKTLNRYFVQNVSSKKIQEIDQKQFDSFSDKFDNNLYTAVNINWTISGNIINTTNTNGILNLGVKTKNKEAIKKAEKKIPNISAKLTNLLEFYTDTEFIVPADINSK
jgi:hypothetical protein